MKSKKMSQEIEQLITLLQEMNKKMNPKSRLEELTEEIKKTQGLEHLFEYSKNIYCTEFNHLQKCVILTSKFNFLEEYIDLFLTKHPETINNKNEEGLTALMIAARNSNCTSTERTVEILLNHGSDVNLQEIDGWTALMYAAKYSRTDSSEKTVELLLNHGANVDLQEDYGWTALMLAVSFSYNSSVKTVKLLLNHGANVNIQKNNKRTALDLALLGPKKDITEETVKLIIEKMDSCDILMEGKKLIKYLFDKDFPDDIIELVIQKGAKRFDLLNTRLYKLLQL